MLSTFSQLKKQTWLRQTKDLRYGLLFALSFFLILNGGEAHPTQGVPAPAPAPTGSGSCLGWLCGPKASLTATFPDGTVIINTGFVMMQGVVIAIVAGIAAVLINRIANREDYGGPMATFFGVLLVLLAVNALAGYVFGSAAATATGG